MLRYLIGFLIGIGLIILIFVMIFRGGGDPAPAPNQTKKMVDYANTSTVVSFVDDYMINANQEHRQVEITVGRDQVHFAIEKGYEGDVARAQDYPNNPTAYADFLRALQLAGYTNGDSNSDLKDERGFCPLGHRYIFEIRDGSRMIQRLWSTSCGNIGNYKGRSDTVRTLFRQQVPDYNRLFVGFDQL